MELPLTVPSFNYRLLKAKWTMLSALSTIHAPSSWIPYTINVNSAENLNDLFVTCMITSLLADVIGGDFALDKTASPTKNYLSTESSKWKLSSNLGVTYRSSLPRRRVHIVNNQLIQPDVSGYSPRHCGNELSGQQTSYVPHYLLVKSGQDRQLAMA